MILSYITYYLHICICSTPSRAYLDLPGKLDSQVDPGPLWVSQGIPTEDGEDEDGYFRSVGAYSIFISTFYGFNIRQDVFLLRSRVTMK